MKEIILVRFGDLVLKGKNKPTFINQVKKLLRSKLDGFSVNFEYQHDRIFIHINSEDKEEILKQLRFVSGVQSYSFVYRVEKDLEKIAEKAIEIIPNEIPLPTTFKVETKRADKRFPMTSTEVSQKVAGMVLPKISGLKVDVRNPEHILNIEIRNDGAFIYIGKISGLGGFPIGIGGRALLMLSGGIDSPVAAYLMMKQGVEIELFHFESTPLTPLESVQKVIDISKKLAPYMTRNKIKLHLVPFTKIHEEILKYVSDPYIITIMRRMMYRLAERYALTHDIQALVNGESVGQVASQTLDSINVVENVTNIPILRPVVTYDKNDIIKLSKMLETYDVSIRPFNDCCSIYVPRRPVTHPKVEYALEEETKLNVEKLMEEALENIQTLMINKNTDFEIALYGFEVKDAIEAYRGDKK
ncbi:tRNA 4-thiouridine(8) synthase ThiI [Acholeplasma equirhinis]|uniref:tRNA uracil 4-sulfurtransferase ThiI n=1 Tax=Acholeplasma equirhinis TaxID=555393 RepID=UPI00197A8C17|nr:tRNA uracil 4-sulfurtransferase ThiI [Acholeplasma equirhinis]MBN3491164.1 tRNA 4-thiouridine(8) synthase ThiI [Acholeplasma equirhinis]